MKRFTATIALILLLLCLTQPAAARYDVKAVLVMDMYSGQILLEQNADKQIAPASLTKILTMYLVWEDVEQGRVKLEDTVTISKAAAATGGSSMKLVKGEEVTVYDLMRGMGIASGNDACVAVAEYISGKEEQFVERMNRKAGFLGMQSTTFKNPHGLPAEGQLTTARDMMRLASAYLRRFPGSLEIHSKTHMYHRKIKRKNSNKLLGRIEGVDGLKTGYVSASGFNIIVTAERNNRRLLAVVLGGRTSAVRNREATKILEASFNMPQKQPRMRLVQEPHKQQRAVVHAAMRQAATRSTSSRGPSLRAAIPKDVDTLEQQVLQGSYVPPGQDIYALHESSWRSRAKADKRASTLQRRGLKARIQRVNLGSKGVWHRIYIGSFSSMRQARNYKNSLVRRMGMGHAVILKIDS